MRSTHNMFVMMIALTVLFSPQLVLAGVSSSGEEAPSAIESELLRSDIQMKTMTLMAGRMHFYGKEADAFWPIYRKYDSTTRIWRRLTRRRLPLP